MQYDHLVERKDVHYYFDACYEPLCRVLPGQTVKFETERADGMVLTEESPVFKDRQEVLVSGPNPVTGPIYVEGAEPGDRVAVAVLEVAPCPDGSLAYVTHVPGPSGLMPPFSIREELPPRTYWCRVVKDGGTGKDGSGYGDGTIAWGPLCKDALGTTLRTAHQ